jgi:hypothetical protein
MKQTVIVLTLLLASLAALALSRGVVLLLDGVAQRWACFGLGFIGGVIATGLVMWIVVDDLKARGWKL